MRESSNPVFRSVEKGNTESYTNAASFAGISIKTGTLLLVALLSAVGASFLLRENPSAAFAILGVSGIVGFISVMIGILIPRVAAPFSILYSAAEGFLLGAVTALLETVVPGIGLTAVLGTLVIFGVMLALYASRTIRATNRLRKTMYGMIIGILIFSILAIFIKPLNTLFISNPVVGILFSLFFIGYGAIMLVLDFDRAEYIVQSGADKKYEWSVSLGLMVTIFWIYLEIVRLVALLAANKN